MWCFVWLAALLFAVSLPIAASARLMKQLAQAIRSYRSLLALIRSRSVSKKISELVQRSNYFVPILGFDVPLPVTAEIH